MEECKSYFLTTLHIMAAHFFVHFFALFFHDFNVKLPETPKYTF